MLQGEHSAILSTFIKLPFIVKIFFSIFECPFYTGFTVIYPFDFRMLKTTLSFTINSVRVNIDDKKARCLTVMGEVGEIMSLG